MKKVLVVSGHPDINTSNANAHILKEVASECEAQIRYLDKIYTDFEISVEEEQEHLRNCSILVLQFPFYWYSVPAILKNWIDKVFLYGFAYGTDGDKLKGKDFLLSFTVGGPIESYGPLGYNHFPIPELVKPLEQMAYLAGMIYHPPIYTHRMAYVEGVYDPKVLDGVMQKALEHSERLIAYIKRLQESGA